MLEAHRDESSHVVVRQPVDSALAISAIGHKPAVPQDPKLVAHPGLADARDLGEIAHAQLADGKCIEDSESSRVGQRREDGCRQVHAYVIGHVLADPRDRDGVDEHVAFEGFIMSI